MAVNGSSRSGRSRGETLGFSRCWGCAGEFAHLPTGNPLSGAASSRLERSAVRVLVTGSSGLVGAAAVPVLRDAGHEVVPFDRADGQDITSKTDVRAAIEDVDGVVHLAAVLGWHGEPAQDFLQVNTVGTWRLLHEAQRVGVRRFVFVSSIDVLGVFKGHRPPDYLPLDDDHPCYANAPYALSKHLAEVACTDFWTTHGLETVVLRPPGVWSDETYGAIKAARQADPTYEWSPFWEYGAFLDRRDLATAIERALVAEYPGPKPFGVAADDINSSSGTSLEWARRIHPEVPLRHVDEFEGSPYRTLLDNSRAKTSLGWSAMHRWRPSHA
jgi:UDP-glucose 4-epimerase